MLAHPVGDRPLELEILGELPDAVMSLDGALRFTYVNPAAERLLARTHAELLGRRLWSEPPDLNEMVRACQRALDEGVEITVESYVARLERWFEARCVPRTDGLIVLVRDISDAVQAREARAPDDLHHLLAEITEALAGPLDYVDTLQRIVDLAADRASDIAFIDVVGEDERLVRLAGAVRDPALHEDAIAAMAFPLAVDADLSPARAFREQRIIIEQPGTADGMNRVARSEAHREVIARLGPMSTMFLPLVARGRSYGLLTLVSTSGGHSPRDIAFAEELGRRAVLVLENAQLYRAARCAAAAARRERERIYSVLLKAPIALGLARGPECVLEFINEAGQRFLRGNEAIGRPIREASPDLGHLDAWLGAFSTGEPVVRSSVPFEMAGDGDAPATTRWFDLRFEPMRDADGAVEGVMGMAYDLTEQVLARREVEQLVDELGEEARLRDLFVGVLAHDLRNPLAAILLSTGLLDGRPDLPDDATRVLHRIETSAHRMSSLIEQVLDLTRARAGGGIALSRRATDLAELCRVMIDELTIASPGRPIDMVTETDARGAWDPDRLGQVLSNLLGNAMTYSPPGTRVDVRLGGDAERVTLTVHNLGPAIPGHLLSTLFDPFHRATTQRSGRSGGLGLGLYITDQIVRAHGGTIDVVSSEPEGTRFTVSLPRA